MTHNDIGGWNDMPDAYDHPRGSSRGRSRGPTPNPMMDALPDDGLEKKKVKSGLATGQCNPLLRPCRMIGLDLQEMIAAADAAVQRFEVQLK